MKLIKLGVLCCLMLMLGTTAVFAEEPAWVPDDAFYQEHLEGCVVHGREYIANGPDNQVVVYESPASAKVKYTLENGEQVLIDYIYTNENGIQWGFCEYLGESGWLPMPYMWLVYDYISFEEDYGDQLEKKSAQMDSRVYYELYEWEGWQIEDHNFKIWSYPGCPTYTVLTLDRHMHAMPKYSSVFVDEYSRTWGYIKSYGGEPVNKWICVTNPLAEYDYLYPRGVVRGNNSADILPYTGDIIVPDDYEHVKMMGYVKLTGIVVGSMLALVVLIVIIKKGMKIVKQENAFL